VIESNRINDNWSQVNGAGLAYCDGTIRNNVISGNAAELSGGGLYGCHGTIENNTIAGNSAGQNGGGVYDCDGVIRNSIIWANTASSGSQLYGSSTPSFSCIAGWSSGGEGSIAEAPTFLDVGNRDFRLSTDSPCIDAGFNDPGLPETDMAGMHRIMFGGKSLTVDIGAYEFHIWPPTENTQTGEMTLKWSSLAGKTHTVYHSSDMFTWDVLADDLASAGDTVTTWIDPPAPILPPGVQRRYYKIAEKPVGITFRR